MKILIAVDDSVYTLRTLAYLAAHEDMFGPPHEYTVVHAVLAVTPRAASFAGAKLVRQGRGRRGQCDISTGTVIESSMPRVAPPRTRSVQRACP